MQNERFGTQKFWLQNNEHVCALIRVSHKYELVDAIRVHCSILEVSLRARGTITLAIPVGVQLPLKEVLPIQVQNFMQVRWTLFRGKLAEVSDHKGSSVMLPSKPKGSTSSWRTPLPKCIMHASIRSGKTK